MLLSSVCLTLEEWKQKSQVQIAEHIGVTQQFVSTVKKQVTSIVTSPVVTGKDGKQYPARGGNVADIGGMAKEEYDIDC